MLDLSPELLVLGFLWYIAFLFSTTCHEASHALAAKLGGDVTAAEGGQVTLNPVPHMRREFFGMVIVPLLSFLFAHSMIGWASAPYDPNWERRHPRRAALMALAGPAANFTLMILAAVLIRFGRHYGWFHHDAATGAPSISGVVLAIFFSLNLLLGVFNLLPVPPLDGSTAVMLFMSEKRAAGYLDWLRGNSYALAGLLIALLIFRYAYGPIEDAATQFFLYRPF
jgi:Zn-dependent protease